MFNQGTILISGGTGFLGRHLVRRALANGMKKVVVYARSEKSHYDLRCTFASNLDRLESIIGDVRDLERLSEAMDGVELVVHAAALKHISHCEEHPGEAYRTNVVGTENVIRACRRMARTPGIVFISTDKAVAPVNVYGATKMIQEGLFRASGLPCVGVRYGNVLSSSGSVVPFFRSLAQQGKDLPVTHPDMTRFFITADEAVRLVEMAAREAWATPGTIFVPKPRSARIVDVAEAFAKKYSVKWHVVGARPGEKLHERLVSERDAGLCEDLGDTVAIRAPKSGFDNLDRETVIDLADFVSSGPLMTAREVRKFLEEEGEV